MGLDRTFAKILARRGVDFTSGGLGYRGVRTQARNVRDALPQGKRDAYQFSLVVPVATGEAIDLEARVTVGARAYRVARKTDDGLGVTAILHLIED